MTWATADFRGLSEELLGESGNRWLHVQAVVAAVGEWQLDERTRWLIESAAWLHDIGYAAQLRDTGMHAIDGARFLDLEGVPVEVVSLVAFHTGAEYEADERGLMHRLVEFDRPSQEDLDLLILADLVSGPDGARVSVEARIEDIFSRYEPQHPVHRAVTNSRLYLTQCASRAVARSSIRPSAGQPDG